MYQQMPQRLIQAEYVTAKDLDHTNKRAENAPVRASSSHLKVAAVLRIKAEGTATEDHESIHHS